MRQHTQRPAIKLRPQWLPFDPGHANHGVTKNNANGGRRLAFVDLRNLGPSRTLVPINGHRVVATGLGRAEAVDLNNIPLQLVERVDVLLDGASSVYGADAVGGVINVLLRDDFDGMKLEALGGILGVAMPQSWADPF